MERLNEPVFLVGFPGSGKTTLGRELARLTGWPLVDLDEWIELRQGKSIKQLYSDVGEERFRELEREALRQVSIDRALVACGGGTPCAPGNMAWMNAHGLTVWLTTSPERLIARLCLSDHRSKRPHIATLSDAQIARYVRDTLAAREPWYAQARLRFDATMIETADETTITASRLRDLITTHIK